MFYIGIDIAKHKHEASIIDSSGKFLCESMDKELKRPNFGSDNRVKSGFHNKKQWDLCKECGCYYTVGQRGYPEYIRRKAKQLYL